MIPRYFRLVGGAGMLALVGSLLLSSPVEPEQLRTYADVSDKAQYHDAVMDLYQRGLIRGGMETQFRPEDTLNRAEVLKMLLTARFGTDALESTSELSFTDVAADAWFAPYVLFAAEHGIASGYGDGRFAPEQVVTLAEATKMVLAAYDLPVERVSPTSWFLPYMDVAQEAGLHDYLSRTVAEAPMSRSDFAQMLYNALSPKVPVDEVVDN